MGQKRNPYMAIISTFDKSFGIPLSGRYLAHNHLTRSARAFLAADLVNGKCRLYEPTLTQAALLARVGYTTAWWASQRQAERTAILDGLLPLVPPRIPASRTVSDSELADAIRSVGVEHTLMVAAQVEADMKVAA
jgi:hypothetical protein